MPRRRLVGLPGMNGTSGSHCSLAAMLRSVGRRRDSRGTEDGGMFLRGLSAEIFDGSFEAEGEPKGTGGTSFTASAETVFFAALSVFSA